MKQLWSLCLLVFLGGSAWAQSPKNIQNIAELLEKSKVFVEYRKFRNNFEEMNTTAGKHLIFAEDYVKLNVAYNDIQEQYNAFLGSVKKDLSTWSTIREMVAKPDAFALRYLDRYGAVVDAYQRDYIPIYKAVTAPGRSTMRQDKAITPAMVIFGVELFLEIIDLIKARRGGEDDGENYVLATINAYFVRKLEMKPWSELAVPMPGSGVANAIEKPSKKKKKVRMEAQVVASPVYDQLEGWVAFNTVDQAQKIAQMGFSKSKSKDIGVEVLKNKQGKIETVTASVQTAVFVSKLRYKEGAQFQLKATNTAGMYVFSLKSDGTIQFLYPYRNESLKGCDRALGTGKDIGVLPATFVAGRDRSQTTTLPAPDCSVTPPEERYFTITAPMPATKMEQFCVLLTKSEINTEKMTEWMNKTDGDIQERLAKVLGTNMIAPKDAALTMSNNRLKFKASNTSGTVLPVVFSVLRQ